MTHNEPTSLSRAQGCLLGQLAGDALGSLVEFQTCEAIRLRYPKGVRDLEDGGTWSTVAGQPTDDSEMALLLARMLVELGRYNEYEAKRVYTYWLESDPFDCGKTVRAGLLGNPIMESQANGALMRISPLGIFGSNHDLQDVAEWARTDAFITHPHPVCGQVNALFAMAIAHAIKSGCNSETLYLRIKTWAEEMSVEESVAQVISKAVKSQPSDFMKNQGWVLLAFQNALWQLLHAENLEEAIIDTVERGGDTDTNAAICGALLGAVYGMSALPKRWTTIILNCRPEQGRSGVLEPRPECFWPVDALELARLLMELAK